MKTKSTASEKTTRPEQFRQMPNAADVEEEILSACLLGATPEVIKHLAVDDFYKSSHKIIFEAITCMHEAGDVIDLVTVTMRLKDTGKIDDAGGISAIAKMVDRIPAPLNLSAYCEIVRRAALRRKIIAQCNALSQQAFDDPEIDTVIDCAKKLSTIDACATDAGKLFSGYRELSETMPDKWEQIKTKPAGIQTGFAK